MKKINNLLYTSLLMLFIVSCVGEKGDVGPQGLQGDAGKDGVDGVAGEKGPQGDKGATGETGIIGEQGTQTSQTINATNWIDFKDFAQANSTLDSYTRIRGGIPLTSLAATIGDNNNNRSISINSESSTGIVTDGKNVYGNIYVFYKIIHNNTETYFTNGHKNPQFEIYTGVFPTGASIYNSMSVYYPINLYPNKTINDLISLTIDLKPAIRYVYVPLNLVNGRAASVDMSNYEEVKKAFNLKD